MLGHTKLLRAVKTFMIICARSNTDALREVRALRQKRAGAHTPCLSSFPRLACSNYLACQQYTAAARARRKLKSVPLPPLHVVQKRRLVLHGN